MSKSTLTKCDSEGVPLFIQSVTPEGWHTGFYNVLFFNGAYGLFKINDLLPRFATIDTTKESLGVASMRYINSHKEQQKLLMDIFTSEIKYHEY